MASEGLCENQMSLCEQRKAVLSPVSLLLNFECDLHPDSPNPQFGDAYRNLSR